MRKLTIQHINCNGGLDLSNSIKGVSNAKLEYIKKKHSTRGLKISNKDESIYIVSFKDDSDVEKMKKYFNILKSFDVKPFFIILYKKVVNESIMSTWNKILSETGYVPMPWGGSTDVLYYDLCDDKIEPLVSKELEYYIKNLKGWEDE